MPQINRQYKIIPFKENSTGAHILAEQLNGTLIHPEELRGYVATREDTFINWGCGFTRSGFDIINPPNSICKAVNKITAYKLFRQNDINRPEFTTKQGEALRWLHQGNKIYARTTMEGERGQGITVLQTLQDWTDYHINDDTYRVTYTIGFPIHREFRIHVAFGKVIEVNEKKRRNNTNPDPLIRSSADWVFCVYNLAPYPEIICEKSIAAIEALGLDFGGVDIALDVNNNYCVFEVNTAPWINRESTTQAYVKAFKEIE